MVTLAIVNSVLIPRKLRPLLRSHDHGNYGRDTVLRAVVHEHVSLLGNPQLHSCLRIKRPCCSLTVFTQKIEILISNWSDSITGPKTMFCRQQWNAATIRNCNLKCPPFWLLWDDKIQADIISKWFDIRYRRFSREMSTRGNRGTVLMDGNGTFCSKLSLWLLWENI